MVVMKWGMLGYWGGLRDWGICWVLGEDDGDDDDDDAFENVGVAVSVFKKMVCRR